MAEAKLEVAEALEREEAFRVLTEYFGGSSPDSRQPVAFHAQ